MVALRGEAKVGSRGGSNMKILARIGGIFGLFLMAACSTNYSTLDKKSDGYQIIYEMSENEALQIAYSAMVGSFPGRKIEKLDGPARGFSTYTRMMLDTYTQQVLAFPVVGHDKSGKNVEGFYFEVSGSGSSGSGMIRNGKFFENLQVALDKTGKAISVVDMMPRPFQTEFASSPKPPTEVEQEPARRLEALKHLLDIGAISTEEYEAKKKEILREL